MAFSLPDVAWIVVRDEQTHRARGGAEDPLAGDRRVFIDEVRDEQRDFLLSLQERGISIVTTLIRK